jgi:acetamidase/formamidase
MRKPLNMFQKALGSFLLLSTLTLPLAGASLAKNNEIAAADLPATKSGTSTTILQQISTTPCKLPSGTYYVPASLSTIRWGILPNRDSRPILTIPSKSLVTFDVLSSEGMVEDQGRDPVKFFGKFGVPTSQVLKDAIEICASNTEHNMTTDGPHIVIGPLAIKGAQPGDVLKVDVISLTPRVPYGIIGNRHGKGALPGEFPQNNGPRPGASKQHPELYGSVFTFVPIKHINGKLCGIMHNTAGKEVHFPLSPFLGIMGTAPNTNARLSSAPPGSFGGNLDLKDMTAGSTLYLPIELPQAMFFVADSHFAQGNGEVALTAVEGSLRAILRLTVLKAGDPSIPIKGAFNNPFGETPDYWVPIGLDLDLNEAMKKAVRVSIKFLTDKMGMDPATAMAYLSAATDYQVTQVVDEVKEIHGHIRKKDFPSTSTNK